MSKQFLVFAGYEYYPSGGWEDFDGDFESFEIAKASIGELDYYEWVHIVDTEKHSIVWKAYRSGDGEVHEEKYLVDAIRALSQGMDAMAHAVESLLER